MIPVILAGGKGERFWPLSRKHHPKQFLALDGSNKTLLQATGDRLVQLTQNWSNLWVITAGDLATEIQQQLPLLPNDQILVEPVGKDTAPAVAWTTLAIAQKYGEDAIIGFFPADHWIPDDQSFQNTINLAEEIALTQDCIVTLGIKPDYPSTGYGYIEQGTIQGEIQGNTYYQVQRFTEKPDQVTAQQFLDTGKFSWNSGMFIFKAGVMLQELQQYAPDLLNTLKTKGKEGYYDLRKISIDYAVMENTQLASVLPVNFPWDDLGDWNALYRLFKQEDQPNVAIAQHLGKDTNESLIFNSNSEEIIVTIGLEDVVIVRDKNATLIVKKDRTQEIKQVLKELENNPQWQQFL
jgi:mannose-1-phosphate guanylyltransferase